MHSHGHQHGHHHGTAGVLKWSFFATLLFVVVEAIAGFHSGSLALVSDAGHNFTDALALVLAAIGVYMQSKPADSVKTFGYHRAGVLTAFVNALTLVVISAFIFYEAWQRFMHPRHIEEWTMLWVAVAALVLNGGIMWGLYRDKDRDLNIRAAFVHMLGDAVSSVGIIAGAIAIHFTGLARHRPGSIRPDRHSDRLDRLGHYSRIAQRAAGRPAARHGAEPSHESDLLHRRRHRRSRFAYLELGFERARFELPRAHRRYAAFGELTRSCSASTTFWASTKSTTLLFSSSIPSAMRLALSWSHSTSTSIIANRDPVLGASTQGISGKQVADNCDRIGAGLENFGR